MLFIPMVFQFVAGNKSLNKSISLNYFIVCAISLIFQLVITFFSFLLAIKGIVGSGNKCATGAVGIFVFSFFITLGMLFLMVVQFVRRKLQDKSVKLHE
jgi:uncharacterized membrane protein YhaH (DUF805 family)